MQDAVHAQPRDVLQDAARTSAVAPKGSPAQQVGDFYASGMALPTDGHPPGLYRMAAPSQHEKAFYEAFGIRAGDRMWLDPSDRVTIW